MAPGLYPKASVWVSPGQGGPTDPPLGRVDGVLGTGTPPWSKEIDCKVFYVAPPEPWYCKVGLLVRKMSKVGGPMWIQQQIQLNSAVCFFKDLIATTGTQETAGTYAESAFYHKKTATLLLTDAVLKVPQEPPQILTSYGC